MIIVGAGLVGSLLSLYLSRKGFKVDVYERRPDMRVEKISAGRSINLAISVRGLDALERVGLKSEVLAQAIPMKGRMIHAIDGQLNLQPYGKDDSECINSISRGELNKILMNHAEKSGNVRFHFNQKAHSVDFRSGKMTFKSESDESVSSFNADFIFGTDGSSSAVRSEMGKDEAFSCDQKYLDHGYKELVMPAGPAGAFKMEKNALHIWPRGTYMLIALPNFDGSFTCTLFLPFKGPLSFETLKTPEDVLAFFKQQFPDAVALMPNLLDDFFTHPTGNMVTVKCSPWRKADRALLLGDAAHAIVPFFGQGMNCGFEDVVVLDQCIDRHPGNWGDISKEFETLRKPNADAIADMAVENFVEMRDKVSDARFLLEKKVEKALSQAFPQHYLSRYSMVSFSKIPYRIAYQAGLIHREILDELCDCMKDVDELNLDRAAQLIQRKLRPFMESQLKSSL